MQTITKKKEKPLYRRRKKRWQQTKGRTPRLLPSLQKCMIIILVSINYILLSLIRPQDSWTFTKDYRQIH